MTPFLFMRTLGYLRWEQIAFRPLRAAQYRIYRTLPQFASVWRGTKESVPEIAPTTIEKFRSIFQNEFVHLNTSTADLDSHVQGLVDGKFTFLNRTLKIGQVDWNHRYENHLWNYHLHYFNYAVCCARELLNHGDTRLWGACQRMIEGWIERAKIARSDGWNPYPISLRVVNWIYAYALIADRYEKNEFLNRWRTSIYDQLTFLSHHLEYHLLANHLIKNAKALTIGGLFFNHHEWLTKGEKLLWDEFEEQVLDDGGHFERSPMYHAEVLADYLECYALLKAFGRTRQTGRIEAKLRAMARFLKAMSYPDGTLALFNDSANTDESSPLPIIETTARIAGIDNWRVSPVFPRTGYYLWNSKDEREKIIVDAGQPSAEYNSAHAHCDLLSYELRLDGQPFIVDSGVHGYGGDRYRQYCRSTRAHNTVMFDGREQSEAWATFRMGRRAKLISVRVSSGENTWSFRGGYHPFYDSHLVHERRIYRLAGGDWYFEDRLSNGHAKEATSYIHLHPGVKARKTANQGLAIECLTGRQKVKIEPFNAWGVTIAEGCESTIEGWYFPQFGVAQPSATICFDYHVKRGEPFGYKITKKRE
jgi:uncharacterized heparinase superfamily protein